MNRGLPKTQASVADLDRVDRRLLVLLSSEGRRSGADLAKELGLSRQAVAERIRDLERRRVIRGYRADVNPEALGLAVRAQLRLTLVGSASPKQEREVLRRLTDHPHVRSVCHVSGEDCFVADVVCRRIEDVNVILAAVQATRSIQSSRTSFVLETIVEKRGFGSLTDELARAPST